MDLGRLVRQLALGVTLGFSSYCGSTPVDTSAPCSTAADCRYGRECLDGYCESGEDGDDDTSEELPELIAFVVAIENQHDEELYVMQPDGSGQRRLTFIAAEDTGSSGVRDYTWAKDQQSIIFTASPPPSMAHLPENLYQIDSTTRDIRLLKESDSTVSYEYPTLSPDGKMLAYIVSGWDTTLSEIFLLSLDTFEETRLFQSEGYIGSLCWSSNNGYLAVSDGDGIKILAPDGQNITSISLVGAKQIQCSPTDANIIVYAGRDGIFSVYSDGSQITQLTHSTTSFADQSPKISPNGAYIAFCCSYDLGNTTRPDICIMRSDGSELEKIAENAGFATWSKNGDIAYSSASPSGGINIYKQLLDQGTPLQLTFFQEGGVTSDPQWSPAP